jgi:ABC transporter DrrB family efflux protein
MNGFFPILLKEFMHLRRDPSSLRVLLLLPLIQMVMFGYAINFDVRHIQTVVADLDHSRESRAYLRQLQASNYLDLAADVSSPDAAAQMLKNGTAKVGITIPAGFARAELSGGNPAVGVQIDGSDSQVSIRAMSAFQSAPAQVSPGVPNPRITVLFNPTSRTATFMIPGLIVVILQIVTVSLTAFSIVREKEMGTLEQLMVTPVGRLALMIGKLVPYAVMAIVELGVVLFVSDVLFGVRSHGNLLGLFALSVPFIIGSLGLGLLISTVSQTQSQALQFSQLTLLPSIMLSGYFSPRETLPGWLYVISSVLPATHFMAASRGIIVRGAGFFDFIPQFLFLSLIAAVLLTVSTMRFRKTIA